MVTEKINSVESKNRSFKKLDIFRELGNVIILALIVIVMLIVNPRFLSVGNIINLSRQMVPVGILAIGAMFVIMSGGLDLSAAFGVSLAAIIFGLFYEKSVNIFIIILITVAAGILMGIFNGLLITRLKMLPFIVTLATMAIFQGLTYLIAGAKLIYIENSFTTFLGSGEIWKIPSSFIFLVFFYFIGYLILNQTRLGTYIIAIGNNEKSSVLAGINIDKYKFYIYAFSGLCTGLAAVLLVSKVQMSVPSIGGLSLLLDAVAATILGGTSLSGGKGTIRGTFVGVLLIVIIGNIINLLSIDANYRDVIKGLVIIAVLLFDRAINIKRGA
jgi:ribose/xylose/arabinose/galactoside ABC-type transport system permease subunit